MDRLRAEAAIEAELLPSPPRPPKETRVIAITGKGGDRQELHPRGPLYMMASRGKKVLLIGCDPKERHDLVSFGAAPVRRSSNYSAAEAKLAGEEVSIGDVCFRDGVFAMSLEARGRLPPPPRLPPGFPGVSPPPPTSPRRPGCRSLETCAEGHRRRCERPPVALYCRQQRLLRDAIASTKARAGTSASPASSSTRTITRARRAPSRREGRHPGAGRHSRRTTTSGAQEREVRIIGKPGQPVGGPLRGARAERRVGSAAPSRSDGARRCSICSRAMRSAAASSPARHDRGPLRAPDQGEALARVLYENRRWCDGAFHDRSRDEPRGEGRGGCELPRLEQGELARGGAAAGNGEALERYAADYPWAHDQPQSMCPAFGSLRVGLRMRRTATILSGSACCVYGPRSPRTSTARGGRSVTSRSIRSRSSRASSSRTSRRGLQAGEAELYDAVVIIQPLRAVGLRRAAPPAPRRRSTVFASSASTCRGSAFRHAEAKDVLAGAMLQYARQEAEFGPVAAPRAAAARRPTITLLGEMFPVDPISIGRMLEPLGLAAGPVVPTREWRALLRPRLRRGRRDPSVLHREACASSGRPGAPSSARPRSVRRHRRMAGCHWLGLRRIAREDRRREERGRRSHHGRALRVAIRGRITLSGYEGSSSSWRGFSSRAARGPVRRHGVSAHPWSAADREWLEARGVRVQYRASLEQDYAAMRELGPDLVIGTTPVVQAAKEAGIPALYFTNPDLRPPLMGPAGAGSRSRRSSTPRSPAKERFTRCAPSSKG